MENINDVECLLILSNEGDPDIFYNNNNDKIETFFYFDVIEDKTTVDQKFIITSNIKSYIIFPKNFVVGSHKYKSRYCYCTYKNTQWFLQWKYV